MKKSIFSKIEKKPVLLGLIGVFIVAIATIAVPYIQNYLDRGKDRELIEKNTNIVGETESYNLVADVVDNNNVSQIAQGGDNIYNDNRTEKKEKPELFLDFITTEHHEIIENGNLTIYYDESVDNFCYGIMITDDWKIRIRNNGTATAKNIHMNIQIEGLCIESETSDFSVTSHITGVGGYAEFVYNIKEPINPDEFFILPKLPLEKMHLIDDRELLKETVIVIQIYADDIKSVQLKFPIIISTDRQLMCDFNTNDEQEKVEDLLLKFMIANKENMVEGVGIYAYYLLNPDNMILYEDEIENYQYIYNYMLNNIYADNQNMGYEFKKNAIFWGRIYYRCLYGNSDKNHIEMMINNDLEAHLK